MHFLTEDLHGNIRELTGVGYDRCRDTFSTFQQFAIALQLCRSHEEDHQADAGRSRAGTLVVHCCTLTAYSVD